MGKFGQPLRVAVTSGAMSPPINVTVELYRPRQRSLERLVVRFSGSKGTQTGIGFD